MLCIRAGYWAVLILISILGGGGRVRNMIEMRYVLIPTFKKTRSKIHY